MKKIIVIIFALVFLLAANIFLTKNSFREKEVYPSLNQAIGLTESLLTFEVINGDNKIKIRKNTLCYEIISISYCADNKKIEILKKILNSNIEDIYENTDDNLKRLGFDFKDKSKSIILNETKKLRLGNINQYNEIYVLYNNKIYKISYYQDLLEPSTKIWIDKTKPIIPLLDGDKLDIEISRKGKNICRIKHESTIFNQKYSTIRNSFIDLYPIDIVKVTASQSRSMTNNADVSISIKLQFKGKVESFSIWKKDEFIYMENTNNRNYAYVIPNAVYDNLNIDCVK